MNILFLTLNRFESLDDRTIYSDLLKEFSRNGHFVYAISPLEKRYGKGTHFNNNERTSILNLKIGNIQKTNIIVKGINTIRIEVLFKKAIKKYFSNVKFDLVLYSTPPITLVGAIEYVKKRDSARTYLLLKDIFPQNAVDIGMLSKHGLRGLLYKYFRNKEKQLYRISDCIGCMSQANVDYVIKHNPEVDLRKVEICPNSIEVIDKSVDDITRIEIRSQYEIPIDKKVFVYGGNLGKPQGIPFFIECLKSCSEIDEAFFLIVGDGTEFRLLEEYIKMGTQKNVRLMRSLSKDDYDTMIGACDVGIIFLDHRFTIPNFPSRLLSYMQAKLPVLACTDPNTDLGKVIVDGGFGWWCESNSTETFYQMVSSICSTELMVNKEMEFEYLRKYYSSNVSYSIICGTGENE